MFQRILAATTVMFCIALLGEFIYVNVIKLPVSDVRYLEMAGMQDIVELSREPKLCASDFKERLYFSAATKHGHKVTGVMCSGSRERKSTVKLEHANRLEKI